MKCLPILILALSVLLYSCSKNRTAGSTIETENAVAVQALDQEGKAAQRVVAHIRPIWFVADTASPVSQGSQVSPLNTSVRDVEADSNGWIHCKDLPLGHYRIELVASGKSAVIDFDHFDTVHEQTLNAVALNRFGSLRGSIQLPQGIQHAWIQLYGLDYAVKTDSAGEFHFDSLPSGVFQARAIANGQASEIAEDLVQVLPGYPMNAGSLALPSINTEDPMSWRDSSWIAVKPLISSWMQPLTNPTVLELRLDSSNFDFSQAMNDGRDLRVFDQNHNRLPIQRARWNSNLKRAVIRIRFGTVDSNSQVELRWGKPGAVNPDDAHLWDGISDSVRLALNSVLVGDFEKVSAQTNLLAPISSTYWYLFPLDSTVVINSPTAGDWTTGIVAAGAGRAGNAYHVSYTVKDQQWVMLGAALDSMPRSLATLDSVVFWVRGNGTYVFSLDKNATNGGKAVFGDSLDSIWTRKCVRPADFDSANNIGGNIGWQAVLDGITNITFFAIGGTDFWLDDVRIYGVNRDDLK